MQLISYLPDLSELLGVGSLGVRWWTLLPFEGDLSCHLDMHWLDLLLDMPSPLLTHGFGAF